jgi:hypothetical protein
VQTLALRARPSGRGAELEAKAQADGAVDAHALWWLSHLRRLTPTKLAQWRAAGVHSALGYLSPVRFEELHTHTLVQSLPKNCPTDGVHSRPIR